MAEKKRLHNFLGELLKFSCVKGFKYFATHLRGREEMICSIINEPSVPILLSAANSPASSFSRQDKMPLPTEPGSMVMSQKQQRRLSGYGFINVGLPPASPSDSEVDVDENSTMFLIAGYARYNCPYVWVRSNHERLVRLSSEERAEKDYPLLLKTTSQWQEKDIKVWDVAAELVHICTSPCPPNPFTVDFDYFEALHLPERALASGAMVAFLQKVLESGPHPYDRRVQSDLLKISRWHFQAVLQLVQQGSLQPPPPVQPEKPAQRQSPMKRPPSASGQQGQAASPQVSSQLYYSPQTQYVQQTVSPPSQQFYTGRSRTGYNY